MNVNLVKKTKEYLETIRDGFKYNHWHMTRRFSEGELDGDICLEDYVSFSSFASLHEKQMVKGFLRRISRFDPIEKRCLYCIYVLGISESSLRCGFGNRGDCSYEYNIGHPKEVHKRALVHFGMTMDILELQTETEEECDYEQFT
ncbi:MAG: hypothetical protein HUJ53_06605 [Holdemanella sp.]|nr:hypothetical protein [Holdemanella sp.]